MQLINFLYQPKAEDSEEYTIAYHKTGTGAVVVLLHGFGEDYTVWNNLVIALQTNYTCIVIHLPGTGNSSTNPKLATIETCSDILDKILEKEGIEKCVVLGHSMGGYIALHFANNYGAKLLGLGLLHSTATADTEEKKAARLKSIAFLEENGAALFLQQTTPNLFAQHYVITHKEGLQKFIVSMLYLPKQVLINYTKTMLHRQDHIDFLRTTHLPILYIIGKEDNAVPFTISMQQCHLPKISYIHLLKNVGHMGMFEEPEVFNSIVRSYLEEVTLKI